MKTELRVYHTRERLIRDFERMAVGASKYEGVKITPHIEIYIPNVMKMVFNLDEIRNVAGYMPDKLFIDEFVSLEV